MVHKTTRFNIPYNRKFVQDAHENYYLYNIQEIGPFQNPRATKTDSLISDTLQNIKERKNSGIKICGVRPSTGGVGFVNQTANREVCKKKS